MHHVQHGVKHAAQTAIFVNASEDDPFARQVYDEAMQLRGANPGMTWAQIAARVGVVERTLRNYRSAFDED